MVDGRTEPFVHEKARTELLNRTKIVVNLLRTPYDDNTLRMFIAMPNQAMVVSEPIMKHNDLLVPGVHFAEAPLERLADKIVHFLSRPSERETFVRAAHQLTTEKAATRCMLAKIMSLAAARAPVSKRDFFPRLCGSRSVGAPIGRLIRRQSGAQGRARPARINRAAYSSFRSFPDFSFA